VDERLVHKGARLTSVRRFSRSHITCWLCFFVLACLTLCGRGEAQPSSTAQNNQQRGPAENRTIPALLVSDIHFDPFHDPAKARQLVRAPLSQWNSVLSAADSPHQQQAFASLQETCHARGVDTPYALLRSSLDAMRSQQPDAKFITVSGDLIAHAFSCRYTKLFPGSAPGDYQAFVLKTIGFVTDQLRASFPGVPVYIALGNNDTACGDYRLDASSEFLRQGGAIIAEDLPASERQQAIKQFAVGGYYSVTMAAPMHDTRLIVVNDLFFSPRYSTCSGKPDAAAAAAQIAWLQQQLEQARRLGQKVWVMGHIPPGVNPYSTVTKFRDVCGGESPEMFLSSDKMADLLAENAGVVRLAIFAHTHMDEMRLLEPEHAGSQPPPEQGVALKIVPSISPVDGNNPSFTVAQINPSSAVLQNYGVIAASNQTGIATTWSKEYDYTQAYHEAQFSPSDLNGLFAAFKDDRGANTAASEAYIRNYYVGDRSLELKPFWRQYVCSLANYTATGFAACVCAPGYLDHK
jgi:sphingomyelin phosphodiesterase acid-like 3